MNMNYPRLHSRGQMNIPQLHSRGHMNYPRLQSGGKSTAHLYRALAQHLLACIQKAKFRLTAVLGTRMFPKFVNDFSQFRMSNTAFHVFYEDHDGLGFYVGSYSDSDEAENKARYAWKLLENDGTDKSDEIRKIASAWRRFNINEDTEDSHLYARGLMISSGLCSALMFQSDDNDFVEKYIKFRGTMQSELFTRENYEKSVMYNYELKRSLAMKKALRKGKELPVSKNRIIISCVSYLMEKGYQNVEAIRKFSFQEIEVTDKFFSNMEFTDSISLSLEDEDLKNEILDFETWFKYDIDLTARYYDTERNILRFELDDIACFDSSLLDS
jgi:hypothetical protein